MDHEERERNDRTQLGTGATGPADRSGSSERIVATERIIASPSAPTISAGSLATGTGAPPLADRKSVV